MALADLHVHSTVSDGSFSVDEILAAAKEKGITHLAFTDHDTTSGAEAHAAQARAAGIEAICGVEMSAYAPDLQCKAHILGYGYKTTAHIEALGCETLRKRHENGLKQMAILESLGYRVPLDEVAALATGGCIYKQHILDYLVKSGQSEALYGDIYYKIFKNGGPCDFDIDYPAAADAVRAIKADGGWAVLAHPGQQQNFALLEELVALGLDGIEYRHPSHSAADCEKVQTLATQHGLFLTGGSDFHGRYERVPTVLGDYPADESALVMFESGAHK